MGNTNKVNYQRLLDDKLAELENEGKVPSLLLHACCAPCSSYCLEYLAKHFDITVFFYNPNIYPEAEYTKRVLEIQRLLKEMPVKHAVSFLEGVYEPARFFDIAKGLEKAPEGGERCFKCYRLRLEESARVAKEKSFSFFSTTLSISPLKNAEKLNEIGAELAQKYGVPYLFSDFKKKGGYQRSIELSKQYDLYRQNFCGCVYSKRQAEERTNAEN